MKHAYKSTSYINIYSTLHIHSDSHIHLYFINWLEDHPILLLYVKDISHLWLEKNQPWHVDFPFTRSDDLCHSLLCINSVVCQPGIFSQSDNPCHFPFCINIIASAASISALLKPLYSPFFRTYGTPCAFSRCMSRVFFLEKWFVCPVSARHSGHENSPLCPRMCSASAAFEGRTRRQMVHGKRWRSGRWMPPLGANCETGGAGAGGTGTGRRGAGRSG